FNKALSQITGYSSDELHQRGLHGIEPTEYAARIKPNIEMLFQQGEASFESAYLCKTGGVLPIEVHARLVNMSGSKLCLSVVRDITERSEMEKRLHKVGMEWSNTFDAVEDAIWLLDMDQRILRANKATESIFGLSPEAVIGRFCCEVAHHSNTPIISCPTKAMLESASRSSSQLQIAGKWFEVSVDPIFSGDGEIINIVHIVSNITDLKRAELREHTRADILERIVSGESLSNLLSFIALSIEKENPEMLCSILLVSEDGKRLNNGAAPSLPDFYNIATHGTKIVDGRGSCGTAAFRRERVVVSDIAEHPFWKGFKAAEEAGLRSCWSEPIISSTGILLGTFAIYHRTPATPTEDDFFLIQQASAFTSIAIERSQGEAERLELEHLLSQSQKMEAIGHLSGGIAHDFNNLLTPILIYSEMLKRSISPDNEKAKSQLDGIVKASGKARDLTQQLLSFGRKQVMQMHVLDLNDVVMSFHSMLRRTLRENISISLQLSSQPVVVRADSSKLEQVLLNLVLNSQDAIAANGSISIETGQVLVDDEVARRHPGMEAGRFVLLSCTDNGCGMNSETMTRIFEPFFSTKEVGHGTGLGLANVYGIVKQHKGYIMALSNVGIGTTFKIYLPLCDEKPNGIHIDEAQVDMGQRGNANILLVEDNETVRLMTAELLGDFGYNVFIAEHPERALEILKEISCKIDLVITDVVMPGMNGQQLFERIASEHPEINRVLYMSGYTDNIIVTDGELEDGLHFLQKPFTVDSLMGKVKLLLQMENEGVA
ncbi:MAG: PAS domain S-box protein, partial [Desulfuromonadaceae bacterium]|nr:PAS domain S-box protein [Desulfuromonadaceae bacterium]